jgi:ubiquinone/menaquinone biosynthesis C-methylase UbiE
MLLFDSNQFYGMFHQKLNHSAIFRGENWPLNFDALKEGSSHKFFTLYDTMVQEGGNEYDLDRARTAIFYLRSILERHLLNGADKVCVEIGCGIGTKALAINDLFGQYFGIDTQADQIKIAQTRSKSLNITNTTFIPANAVEALRSPEAYGLPRHIDVLLLYAVLEHLTPDERVEIFTIVDMVIASGGHIIIMETPNRLVPFDSHTTGTHFINWLPDSLAYRIIPQTPFGRNFTGFNLQSTPEEAVTTIYRAGRGVSFHDFETGLCRNIAEYGFLMNSYSCESLSIDPFQSQEFDLFGYLKNHVLDIPPAVFSRSWIETIISANPADTAHTTYLSPWWPRWAIYDAPPQFWHPPARKFSKQHPCWEAEPNIELGGEILFLFSGVDDRLRFWLNGHLIDELEASELVDARPSRPHAMFTVAYNSLCPISSIRLESLRGEAVFHGVFVHSR